MTSGGELDIGFGSAVRMTAGDGRGEASCGTLIGTLRPWPWFGFISGFSDDGCEGWYEIAFRLGIKFRRGITGVTGGLPTLGADNDEEVDGGRARGRKKGRFAALREFGGSSE
jgi:hypothetical protein